MRLAIFLLTLLLSVIHANPKTLFVEGTFTSVVKVKHDMYFDITDSLNSFSFKFSLPVDYSNLTNRQTVLSTDVEYSTKPSYVREVRDSFGNKFIEVSWKNLNKPLHISITYVIEKGSIVYKDKVNKNYQTDYQNEEISKYLLPTKLVQSEAPQIAELARSLSRHSSDKHDIVNNIMNFINDNIKYVSNPEKYDAIWTLENRVGNCQNMAHLAIALLRSLGIPARIVGGITIREPWEIKLKDRTIRYSMGQGGHAWVEVYLPDTGWVEYDPQQSKYFVSTRHIRQTHGLDSDDINDSWSGSPYLPPYTENISYQMLQDDNKINLIAENPLPRSYIASLLYKPLSDIKEQQIIENKSNSNSGKFSKVVKNEIGNTNFQGTIEVYRVFENKGYRIFDRENAELMTKSRIFAQGFRLEKESKIKMISLGLKKFGGEGKLFLFLAYDNNGKPSENGIKSIEIDSKVLQKKAGYSWIDFSFEKEPVLKPGKYWIILGFKGDLILNWLYTPNNPYGDEDDTISTSPNFEWNKVHNFDFIFKVTYVNPTK